MRLESELLIYRFSGLTFGPFITYIAKVIENILLHGPMPKPLV